MTTKIYRTENHEFSFWTPVKYKEHAITQTHKVMEGIDGYFNLGGRVAVVVSPPQNNRNIDIQIQEDHSPLCLTILKIISYATIIIPAIMLVAKYILRSSYVFNLIGVNTSKNPAIGKLLSEYRLADNAKTYSDLMERIYSKIPEPTQEQIRTFPDTLLRLDPDRMEDRICDAFRALVE